MSLISLTDYRPMPRYDGKSWSGARIDGATDDAGPWSTIATVPFQEFDSDPAEPMERNFTISVEDAGTNWLRVVFVDEQGEQDVTNPVSTTAATTELATIRDVAKRLGRFLTDGEEVQVNALITMATNNVYAAVDKSSIWVPSADQRDFLSGLCVELVVRAMPNPHALASQSESLGAHSVTQAYSRDIPGSGVMLTDAETLAARRVVYGGNSGSAKARGVLGTMEDPYYDNDIITDTPPNGNGSGTQGPVGPAGPAGPPGPAGTSAPESLTRVYGPDTATPIPINAWTLIPLTGAWHEFEETAFERVDTGPYAGGIRCLVEGIYTLAGSVIFDPSNQAGTRGVWVTELQTVESWDFRDSGSAAKSLPTPMIVNGEAHLSVGDIIGLQAYSSVATATTTNPNSEWLSATRV
jgi:hypothetical protein